MTYGILRKHFAEYLRQSQIKIDITGFDMEAFSKAMNQELKERLSTIEYIAFEDGDVMSNDEKVASIQSLFQRDFLRSEEHTSELQSQR